MPKSPHLFACCICCLLLSGCPGVEETHNDRPSLSVGVVVDEAGLNDQSFNASAWAGAKKAEKELGVKVLSAESREPADYVRNLRSLAKQDYGLIFAIGFNMEDAIQQVASESTTSPPFPIRRRLDAIQLVASEYPDTKFVIIDGAAPDLKNTASIQFREQEPSFLAGVLAAGMSKHNTIGFVGGQHGPVLDRFEYAYKAGASVQKPDIQVLTQYAETWSDPGKGKELALIQFGQKADVILQAAGKTGLGVIDAVRTQPGGRYVIGTNSNQDSLEQGKVLTSIMKRLDVVVFDTIRQVLDGHFAPSVQSLGLKEGAMSLTDMKFTKQDVPPDVLSAVGRYAEEIKTGMLQVPATSDECTEFLKARLQRKSPVALDAMSR